MPKPLCIDLFCGLGGWAEGFLAEGWDVIGFDIERHDYGTGGYPGQLVIQDVLTLDGRQFRNAAVIVASPPCTEFSYMAMPWSRAKQIARALRGQDEFPAQYTGSRTIPELRRLFDACFCIADEAGVPLIVENVRGAEPWVGGARWHFGSFYFWGDVPALMPSPALRRLKSQVDCSPQLWRDREGDMRTGPREDEGVKAGDRNKNRGNGHEWSHSFADTLGAKVPGFRFDGSGKSFQTASVNGTKSGGYSWSDYGKPDYKPQGFNTTNAQRLREGGKDFATGLGKGHDWRQDPVARYNSKSDSRKAASAQIAKIPFPLAQHIARVFKH